MCEICGCGDAAKPSGLNLQTGKPIAMAGELHDGNAHEHVRADGTRYTDVHSHDHVHSDEHVHPHHHVHVQPHDHVHSQDDVHSHDVHSHHVHAHYPPRAGESHHGPHPGGADAQQGPAAVLQLEARVLAKNDALAERNRTWLAERKILAVNLMSAPGAGKTTLLERTIRDTAATTAVFVLEGDQATANDAERIQAAGAAVVQINTGTGCHLDADMVARGLAELNPATGSLVVIENVGNLVCPALFDIGERHRVVLLSVTEGDDKPLKYPHMFRAAELVLLNKIDLLPYVDFDVARATANARLVNPQVSVMTVSARTGEGMDGWYAWLARDMAGAARP
jgi:hydrogenase nickel incorporation protein HypB